MKHVETGTYTRVSVLVTGFGAFPGARINPTTVILQRLERHRERLGRLGVRLRTAQLPVIYDAVQPALHATLGEDKPDVLLHLGLASRRRAICVETRAVNRANPLHPDAARRRTAQRLLAHGPTRLRATYPAARILAAMRGAWLGTVLSIDAGDYLCNAILYRSLAERLCPCTGFIHVPRPGDPTQPRRRTRRPRPGIDALTRAVLAAIVVCVRQAGPSLRTRRDSSIA